MFYAHDGNIFCGRIRTVKKNTSALAVASKEISPDVNTEKMQYVVVSAHQNAVKKHSPNLGNKIF